MLLARSVRDAPPPSKLLQAELAFLRAFMYYVCEKWEAFVFHHEQALAFWHSLGVTRASSLQRHSRLLPIHKARIVNYARVLTRIAN